MNPRELRALLALTREQGRQIAALTGQVAALTGAVRDLTASVAALLGEEQGAPIPEDPPAPSAGGEYLDGDDP